MSATPASTIRRWVAVLLVAAVCASAGISGAVLFATTQVDTLRANLRVYIDDVEQVEYARIAPYGFGGLAVRGLHINRAYEDGSRADLRIERLVAYPRWSALIEGRWETARIVLEAPHLRLSGFVWDSPEESPLQELDWDALFEAVADTRVAIEARRAQVTIDAVDHRPAFGVEIREALIERETPNAALLIEAEGHVGQRSPLRVQGRVVSAQNASLEISCTDLDLAEVLAQWLPNQTPPVTGRVSPIVTLRRTGDDTLRVAVQGDYTNVTGEGLPPVLQNLTGSATGQATFYPGTGALLIDAARTDANRVGGAIAGGIDLAATPPWIDLRFEADRIPATEVLLAAIGEQLENYGELDVALDANAQMSIRLTGAVGQPHVSGSVRSPGGQLAFAPKDDAVPPFRMALANLRGAWDAYRGDWGAEFDVLDGSTEMEAWDVRARNIRAAVKVSPERIVLDAVTFMVNGQPVIGGVDYASDGTLDAWATGKLADIERTALHDAIQDVTVAGAVDFDMRLKRTEGQYSATGRFDATQARVDYEWWFTKPTGVAGGGDFTLAWEPDRAMNITFDGETASSDLYAELGFIPHPEREGWLIAQAAARSERIDLQRLDRLLNLPYRVSGTEATHAFLNWWREPGVAWRNNHHRMGCFAHTLELLAEAPRAEPMRLLGTTVEAAYTTTHEQRTGRLWIAANEARMPAFGEVWTVPIETPSEWREETPRLWTYGLHASQLDAYPWDARDFRAEAYARENTSGFERFAANIENGAIAGSLHSVDSENEIDVSLEWTGVPVRNFLRHLDYPEVMNGLADGRVHYALDRDDPATLTGDGEFTVTGGNFSVDYLYSILVGAGADASITLPPSLAFDELHSSIAFAGDRIDTPKLTLQSPMLAVDGTGHFIHQGDMAYDLAVAIVPDTAETIPIIRDNFNVRGHQISGQPIELRFQVSGPTFNPQGRVAELPPARVTLMSGALEVGREAVNFFDFPRRVLVDLLRMGGGLVGAGTAPRE